MGHKGQQGLCIYERVNFMKYKIIQNVNAIITKYKLQGTWYFRENVQPENI